MDHKSLVHLFEKDNKELMLSPRLQKWLLLVGSFDVQVKYRRGRENYLPEILSRCGVGEDFGEKEQEERKEEHEQGLIRIMAGISRGGPVTWEEIKRVTLKDRELRRIKACLNGRRMWQDGDKTYKYI
ncbi:unnamed protein product [Gordionus sp. m RMFG-2023]